MATPTHSIPLQALLALARALRATAEPQRRASAERYSRPAVEVTSDFGFAPTFPGLR